MDTNTQAVSAFHKAVRSSSRRAQLAATIHGHRAEARNWWHDTPRPVSREDVRSQFNSGRWGNQRMFAQVPASRYND